MTTLFDQVRYAITRRLEENPLYLWLLHASSLLDVATNWRLATQTEWHIDPANGSDTNDGATAATALKTDARRAQLWGWGTVRIANAQTVVYHGTLPVTDVIYYDVELDTGGSLLIEGVPTVAHSGTWIVCSPTNRAFQAMQEVSDINFMNAAMAPYFCKGFFVDTLTGARAAVGATFPNGTNVSVNCTRTSTFLPGNTLLDPGVPVPPSVNDTYNLLVPPTVILGMFRVRSSGNSVSREPLDYPGTVVINNLEIKGLDTYGSEPIDIGSGIWCVTLSTHLNNLTIGQGTSGIVCRSSILENINVVGATFLIAQGCICTGYLNAMQGATVQVDLDTLFDHCYSLYITDSHLQIGTAAFFDSGWHAVALLGMSRADCDVYNDTVALAWGIGNAQQGLLLGAGTYFRYAAAGDLPTINEGAGLGREVHFPDGGNKLWSDLPIAEAASGTYAVTYPD